jgi:hypothetical protein
MEAEDLNADGRCQTMEKHLIKRRIMKSESERECEIFTGSKMGAVASSKSGKDYTVKGSYLDANGCMKTYGKTKSGGDSSSFIRGSDYSRIQH